MAPAADTDEKLLALQVRAAEKRAAHEDLCRRHDVLEANGLLTSATTVRLKRDRAFNEFKKASRELADYISRRQRGARK